jgi:hypothetical protein
LTVFGQKESGQDQKFLTKVKKVDIRNCENSVKFSNFWSKTHFLTTFEKFLSKKKPSVYAGLRGV